MKKKIKIILIVITSIIVLCTILAVVDYIVAINGRAPIFTLRTTNKSKYVAFLENENSTYSGLEYAATEYYGLGYKLVVCDCCEKSVYLMPFGVGAYAWFIGIPIDKLNGRWFHAHSNDIYMNFDGVGNYVLSTDNKITEEGTYILNENSVILTPLNGKDIGNCTIENNFHELHCDKYNEIFMQ